VASAEHGVEFGVGIGGGFGVDIRLVVEVDFRGWLMTSSLGALRFPAPDCAGAAKRGSPLIPWGRMPAAPPEPMSTTELSPFAMLDLLAEREQATA